VEEVLVDEILVRFAICRYVPEIFAGENGGRSFHHWSFHHRSIQHGRFITWTVHHTVKSTQVDSSQKLLYSVNFFNMSFSKVSDTYGDYCQENIYVIVIKKMSKLKFKIKISIKTKSSQNAQN